MNGATLLNARKARGFTQEETAELLGVSQPLLSQMERGHRLVQETVATRAFELFGEPTFLPLNPSRREDETKLANELGAMGYPGFAYLTETPTRNLAELLLDALDRPDLATRVASIPYEYESRLKDFCPGSFELLHLRFMDPYDVALSKLSRNLDRDHDDVMHWHERSLLISNCSRNDTKKSYAPISLVIRRRRTISFSLG